MNLELRETKYKEKFTENIELNPFRQEINTKHYTERKHNQYY